MNDANEKAQKERFALNTLDTNTVLSILVRPRDVSEKYEICMVLILALI